MDETRDGIPNSEQPTIAEDEDAPQPEVARIRRKVRSTARDGRVRSKTIDDSRPNSFGSRGRTTGKRRTLTPLIVSSPAGSSFFQVM